MLLPDNPRLAWTSCAGPLLASFAANNVLPFRAGDVLRSFAFTRQLGTSSGVVIATVFMERLLDFLVVLVLLGVAFSVFDANSTGLSSIKRSAPIVGSIAILFVLLLPILFAPLALALSRFACRISPRLGQRLFSESTRAIGIVRHLAQGHTLAKLIFWSLITWLAEGCVFWFSALALPSIATPSVSWLALPLGTLATLIPSTPGYVGTFDYFVARAMATSGNTPAVTAAYALLIHALLWLPSTVVGGLYFFVYRVRQNDQLKLI